MKKTTNIEFYGGPNSGKSTAASLFTSLLGVNGYVVEIPPKIPANFLLNNHGSSLDDPFILYFKQLEAIKNLQTQTDYAVLDNPLLTELVYLNDKNISTKEKDLLSELITTQHANFDNVSIYIHKGHTILKPSSYFDDENSIKKGIELYKLLKKHELPFVGEYTSHPLVGIEILYDFYEKEMVELKNSDLIKFLKECQSLIKKIKEQEELKPTIYLKPENSVINLYAGPGSGKSTTSRALSALFGGNGISSIAPIEIPKLHVWEKSFHDLSDQLKIFANQKYSQDLCFEKYKVSVVDSPLLMQWVYMEQNKANNTEELKNIILNAFKEREKNCISFFLKREHKYSNYGRVHNEHQSNELNNKIINVLIQNNVHFKSFYTHPFIGFEIFNELVDNYKLINVQEPLLKEFMEITKHYVDVAKSKLEKEDVKKEKMLKKLNDIDVKDV